MKAILTVSQFDDYCEETGAPIEKGERVLYDNGRVYCQASDKYEKFNETS